MNNFFIDNASNLTRNFFMTTLIRKANIIFWLKLSQETCVKFDTFQKPKKNGPFFLLKVSESVIFNNLKFLYYSKK